MLDRVRRLGGLEPLLAGFPDRGAGLGEFELEPVEGSSTINRLRASVSGAAKTDLTSATGMSKPRSRRMTWAIGIHSMR